MYGRTDRRKERQRQTNIPRHLAGDNNVRDVYKTFGDTLKDSYSAHYIISSNYKAELFTQTS